MAATADSRPKGVPTDKMIQAARAAAQRQDASLPEGFDTDFDVCKAFLDAYLNKPSPKALSFAEKIAKDKGLEIPAEIRASSKELSSWIDANKG